MAEDGSGKAPIADWLERGGRLLQNLLPGSCALCGSSCARPICFACHARFFQQVTTRCTICARLLDGAADQLAVYARETEFDAKTRDVLTKVLQLQQGVAEAQRALGQVDVERKQIVDEQARIRENIGKVPAGSDLQKRYLATLEKQENDLDGLAKKKAEAQKAVDAARESLRAYITQLG